MALPRHGKPRVSKLEYFESQIPGYVLEYFQQWGKPLKMTYLSARWSTPLARAGGDLHSTVEKLVAAGKIRVALNETGGKLVMPPMGAWGAPGGKITPIK